MRDCGMVRDIACPMDPWQGAACYQNLFSSSPKFGAFSEMATVYLQLACSAGVELLPFRKLRA